MKLETKCNTSPTLEVGMKGNILGFNKPYPVKIIHIMEDGKYIAVQSKDLTSFEEDRNQRTFIFKKEPTGKWSLAYKNHITGKFNKFKDQLSKLISLELPAI